MDLILFLVGVVVAFAGAALIRYAVPVADPIAGALFTSGIVALVGGLILIGLAAVVRSLGRIGKRLEIQPLLLPVATVNREHPAPRPARTAPAPAAPTRQPLRGWFVRAGAPDAASVAALQPVPSPPKPRPAAKPNGTPETTVYKSGMIDGMAYSLFMDGSIEAELPHGRVKFASVDELQKYLTAR
jgi:hypothetical protein